jgi:hypothetical protein
MDRATRRFHKKRIIKRYHRIFTQYYGWYKDGDPWMSAKMNAGRGSMGCGCCMCANPRRKRAYESGKEKLTIQERCSIINEIQQLEELNSNDEDE